ncbi:MAG: NERD domain-containing protein [Gammaproteobacteria bacterium]|nr:NERD domain-containing protein [Gammaproteobacteria bacterium]
MNYSLYLGRLPQDVLVMAYIVVRSLDTRSTVVSPRRNSQFDPLDVDLEEKSRRRPGQYLRERLIDQGLYVVLILGAVVGLAIACLLYLMVVGWLGLSREFPSFLLYFAGVGLLVAVWWTFPRRNWSARNLLKGMVGETTVADVIERSMLQAFGCFIANDVRLPTTGGNIDHIVVTPQRVLVVETKYRRVIPRVFPQVMRRIVKCTDIVRKYVGSEVEVTGCLVIADPATRVKPTYTLPGGETIHAYTSSTLEAALKQECRKPRTLPEDVLEKTADLAFDAD